VSDAIDGVTLTLKAESEPGDDVALTIDANRSGATTNIKKFVAQYNATIQQLNDLGKFDSATGKAGPLLGDSLLRSVVSDLRRGISDAVPGVTGTVNALAQIGITSNKDGTLQVDDTKLNAALANNFDAVGQLFGSANGVASRLAKSIDARLSTTAEIATRNKTLDQRTKAVSKQQTELNNRMAILEADYRRQFSALDTLMSQSQSTSSFLTQQLASLPKIG
jgi:flagellar hook-associated protein 2